MMNCDSLNSWIPGLPLLELKSECQDADFDGVATAVKNLITSVRVVDAAMWRMVNG